VSLGAGLRGPTAPILAVVFLMTTGMGMVWSVLALYAESLGASATMVGVLIASWGGARLLINLPAGILSQRFGRNRAILAGLTTLAAGSFVAMLTSDFTTLLLCLLIQAVGSAIYITSALSAIADLGTAESRVRDMGAFQAANLIGLSIGPGLGGLIAAHWGYAAPFLAQGVMALAGVVAVTIAPSPSSEAQAKSTPPKDKSAPEPISALGRILPALVGLALMTYGVLFARLASIWIVLPLIVEQRFKLGPNGVGLMLTVSAVANLVVLPLTTAVTRRFGYRSAVVSSTVITVAGLWLLAIGDTVSFAWAAAILLGVGGALALPTLSAYVANVAPSDQMGTAMGLLRTINDIAFITSPILVGLLIDRLGLGYAGGIGGCIAMLIAATVVFMLTVKRTHTLATAHQPEGH
jgi:MFS family permease